jgi:hypothetical protein
MTTDGYPYMPENCIQTVAMHVHVFLRWCTKKQAAFIVMDKTKATLDITIQHIKIAEDLHVVLDIKKFEKDS